MVGLMLNYAHGGGVFIPVVRMILPCDRHILRVCRVAKPIGSIVNMINRDNTLTGYENTD